MGVVDFPVLQKVRSFIAGPRPADDAPADGRPPAMPRSRSGSASPVESPPPSAAARSGGRSAIALRRQISSPQLLRYPSVRYCATPPIAVALFRRPNEEDDYQPGVQFFTPGNDFLHDFSDTDSISVSTPNEINRSLTPSPLESPSWTRGDDGSPTYRKNGCFSPDSPGYGTQAILKSDAALEQINGSITARIGGNTPQYPVDFGSNIWCPPPPEDEGDDIESTLFGFDDEDDEVGDSSRILVPGSFSANKIAGAGEVTNTAQKACLRNAVLGHFQALVAQLLKAEGINLGNDEGSKNWLDIVSSLAWQAACYVRPDTKKGGSMDPTDYVKVKCIASGDPSDSTFVRGVVCSKNVKHKRMVSEHKSAKLLILGGALEYHRVTNKLASIGTILEQEKEHLRKIVGKIEARRPNVLLVEKSASSYAQELLAKDISLVLNVKRPLLDRISRCTGAQIASSVDSIASVRLGQCEMFKVLLRGSCREELKRIKHAVQLAVFAAYHLSLETSFFADEGATLPKFPSRPVLMESDPRNCADNYFAGSPPVGVAHGLESEQDITMVNRMFESISVSPSSLPPNEEAHGLMGDCDHRESEYSIGDLNSREHCVSSATDSCNGDYDLGIQYRHSHNSEKLAKYAHQDEVSEMKYQELNHWDSKPHDDKNEFSGEYFPGTDNHQSILVSLSSTCVPKGLVCERSQLFRIKFYGSFDKPLGRYLREDLFNQVCPIFIPQEWLKSVAVEIFDKMELLHMEVSEFLHRTALKKTIVTEDEPVNEVVQRQLIEMKDLLKMERNEYEVTQLDFFFPFSIFCEAASIDILELNRLRRGLLLDAYVWDRRLGHVDSLLKTHGHVSKTNSDNLDLLLETRLKEWKADLLHGDVEIGKSSVSPRKSMLSRESHLNDTECGMSDTNLYEADDTEDLDKVYSKFNGEKECPITEPANDMEPVERLPSLASIFSDNIDLAWTGSSDLQYDLPQAFTKIDENGSFNLLDSPSCRNGVTPVRIHSFNSTLGLRQRERTGLAPTSLCLSSFKSAEYFRDTASILKDPVPNMWRACSQRSPGVTEKLNVVLTRTPTYVPSAKKMVDDGARLLLPQIGYNDDVVVAVYDDEPTSIVSYVMTSEEYARQITCRLKSSLSFSHLSNPSEFRSHGLEGTLPALQDHLDAKGTHFKFSFDDESPISPDKTKFSVICYFEKYFAALRKKCCPNDIDYIRSLSRCKRWSAQGGKSNVYFAKTMDERFIIKQVTRTELESFVEFAPRYFKYLMESLTSGSPTCLAKIVGLYQVSIKSVKTGREVKMDLMVMENLFFERKISRVYDLKGSLRSRYTSKDSKVLLDLNLIEALHSKPIFLGSKAKRRLERAVWNDTAFLALADVMDYSLLVGIDEEKKELVIGIIDYLRQYTWDKQLETWVKASGILGGPKNESPTVISPMQYKKRFRKAMSKYFLTVPDQWSS
ncbi:hypothetical protein PR202_ga21028 [Eleusine coracana subsp. coracana]|uniref:1-phosphatidylinositol-3-phosphate 5-kinase n=1 Tax=Eleusine coracana subsp. coracana TaxID=191504 RepID=A0AAV5CYL8_ELECO|nr:hypothetical protein PR202_ga21028 [Eleusine coracana subsp. coracana]